MTTLALWCVALAVVGFVATFTVPWADRLERIGFVDVSNDRSMHRGSVPRAGAAALVVGVALGAAAARMLGADPTLTTVTGLAIALAAVGLLDDRCNLPGLPRLAAQAAVAGGLAVMAGTEATHSAPEWSATTRNAAVLVWTLGVTNAVNFMDGVNGLTGTLTLVFSAHLALLAAPDQVIIVPCVLLAAGAIGFLPFNLRSGRVFLGDGGAYFIGAWLAAVVVLAVQRGMPPVLVLAPFAIYAFDTSTALAGRIRRREKLLSGHREHVYQQVVLGGWTHAQSTILVATTTALCAAAAHLVHHEVVSPAIGFGLGLAVLAAYGSAPSVQQWARRPFSEPHHAG